ncbi:flagellar biosynthesis protein FlhB [Campylobacter sp. RM16192]|uniref:flagellar biosynthesis protein FlhB n=1 Tax=Campylobacter sp. RM16192 TaxID=1660080 RepID=UPI0014515403|nr:flagellar biosynthesis protein FlhB [Campylobacter sp. RM16192]QCD53230.1 flagellar export apparatus, flagellar biosynthetic protein FlhB [Campylobacter sp. RM16192]
MADSDQEKTEEATSKKIEDAKKDGNVPKSQDFAGFIILFVAIFAVILLLGFLGDQFFALYIYYQGLIGQEIDAKLLYDIVLVSMLRVLLMVLPITFCVIIAGILANTMQFGFIFTTKPLEPNLNKINPIKGLKNLFSMKKIIEAIKMITKVTIVFGVGFYMFLSFIKELPHTIFLPMIAQLEWLKEKMIILAFVMLIVLFVIGIADLMIVRFQYFKDLRMTKQEVKDEYKQMEGDPQVKSRIRRLQMEASRKRMMQNIPDADVIITNPTHYAIALRYDKTKEKAPVILAKGVDFLALRIKEIGINNGVKIVENPPLARELYKMCDVNEMIPTELFRAVAEVLSFVYMSDREKFGDRLKNK